MSPLTILLVDMETVTPSLISTDSAGTPVKLYDILHQHVPPSLLPSSTLMMKMTRPSLLHSFLASVPLLVVEITQTCPCSKPLLFLPLSVSPLMILLVDMETVTPSLISTDSAGTPVKLHDILHQHVPPSHLPSSTLMMKMTRPSFSHSFSASVPLVVADDYTNMSVFQTIVAFTTICVSTDDTTCGYGDSHSLSDFH